MTRTATHAVRLHAGNLPGEVRRALVLVEHISDPEREVNPNVTIPRDPCADSTDHHRTERPENVDPPRHDL